MNPVSPGIFPSVSSSHPYVANIFHTAQTFTRMSETFLHIEQLASRTVEKPCHPAKAFRHMGKPFGSAAKPLIDTGETLRRKEGGIIHTLGRLLRMASKSIHKATTSAHTEKSLFRALPPRNERKGSRVRERGRERGRC